MWPVFVIFSCITAKIQEFTISVQAKQELFTILQPRFLTLWIKKRIIEFIDIPRDIRDKYQYFTEAKMDKLKAIGYSQNFYSLETGIADYVKNYLLAEKYF